MGITVTTPATTFPVTVLEVKEQSRITSSSEDIWVERAIKAATAFCENHTARSFSAKSLRLTLDEFTDSIMLPRGPVTSVTQIRYLDTEGATQIVPETDYTVDLSNFTSWIVRDTDATWPTILDRVNAVWVDYDVGVSPDEEVRHAILLLAAHWFDDRENGEIPMGVQTLLENHRAFA
ncbi:MAG: hypothetical protein AAGB23_05245 [Pseudomonadota bacterium]